MPINTKERKKVRIIPGAMATSSGDADPHNAVLPVMGFYQPQLASLRKIVSKED